MSWLKRTINSSIGGKFIVAVTGIGMVGFVAVHLSGNLLIFAGRDAMAAYAQGLRTFPLALNLLRAGLLACALAHVFFAVRLNLANRAARPVPYAKKNFVKASFASRSMLLTGLLTLFYILFHLAHFTWRLTSPEIAAFGPYDVYDMLVASFQNPLVSLTYIAAMVLLGLHLSHGISSVFQTLGWNHPKYNPLIRKLGPVLGWLLALGYIAIPVSVLLGVLK